MGFYRRRRKWFILPLVLALTSAELVVAASSQGQEIDAVSPVEYGSFVDNQGIPVEESLNPSDRQRRSQPFQKQTTLPDVPQRPQSPRRNPIPSRRPVAIADIQVRFVDEDGQPTPGNTRPYIITREFDLETGDVYRPDVAQQGLERVTELDSVEDATLSLQQTNQPNQIVMIVNVVEDSSFNVTAFPSASRAKGIYGVLRLEEENLGGNNQNLALELEGGEDTAGFEVSFTDPWIAGDPLRTGYSLAVFNQRSPSEVFIGGDRDVDLPNGETPWVHRLGGSGEVFRPLGENWQAGVGVSYQRVSIRDQAFTDQVQPVDEFGNPLSLSDRGQDDLLTVNLSAVQDNRDDADYPSQGSNVRVGMDQSVPVGEADIIFNRLSGSYTQYVPVE
ncbi:MAG: BamA/TamA family outer membrane protein, partial [Coleofasciculus sp. C2-GNP5-27]